ncbi:MAG: hypothetical protein HKN11_12815 [Rhizobiales bacterium]|nr:hypothetical protein [Hyphomicrobiales bacterium]
MSAIIRQLLTSRVLLVTGLLLMIATFGHVAQAEGEDKTTFRRIPTQYIAALGDPDANSGTGAQTWGLWRWDPGPRGVWLKYYEILKATGGITPARWKFDSQEWWVDENGLLMEKPSFPVPAGKYVVTGDRETVSVLTIHRLDKDGVQRWELDDGVKLHDVTHLPCRSARYTPASGNGSCSPASVQKTAFPVAPGGVMPPAEGCTKQDYSVLFVIGVAVDQ